MENNGTNYRSPRALNAELHAFWSQQDSLELSISKLHHEAKDLQHLVDIAQDMTLIEEMLQAQETIIAARELHRDRGARITNAALLIRKSGKTDPEQVQRQLQDVELPAIADLSSTINEKLQAATSLVQKVDNALTSPSEPTSDPEPSSADVDEAMEPDQPSAPAEAEAPEPTPEPTPEPVSSAQPSQKAPQSSTPDPAPVPEPEQTTPRVAPVTAQQSDRPALDLPGLSPAGTKVSVWVMNAIGRFMEKIEDRQWNPKEEGQTAQPRRKHHGPVPTNGQPTSRRDRLMNQIREARNQEVSHDERP